MSREGDGDLDEGGKGRESWEQQWEERGGCWGIGENGNMV